MRYRLYIMDEEGSAEKIAISSDEIKKIILELNLKDEEKYSNALSEKKIVLVGKMLNQIDKDIADTLDITKFFNNINSISKNDIANKTKMIMNEKYGNNFLNNPIMNLFNGNKKNIKALRNWMLNYGTDTDYRTIIIEKIFDETDPEIFVFENMFIDYFKEEGDIEQGNGSFEVRFRQQITMIDSDKYID